MNLHETDKRHAGYSERSRTQDRPSIISETRRSTDLEQAHSQHKDLRHENKVSEDKTVHMHSVNKQYGKACEQLEYNMSHHNGLTSSDLRMSRDANLMQKLDSKMPPPSQANVIPGVALGVVVKPEKSKLDMEIERIREARLKGTYHSDGEESEDEELKEDRKRIRLLTIAHGPPLKLESSPRVSRNECYCIFYV